ncbi:L,D-transpeptidase [bacterium]|nr:L,D-transpeptidase [bacterium]
MKKFILIVFCLLFFSATSAFAAFSFPFKGVVKSAYTYASTQKEQQNIKPKGSYLPGVYEEKVPKFSNIAANYKTAVEKKKADALKARQTATPGEALLDGKYIDINLSTQTLTTFQDKKAVFASKISSGASGTPTPTGTWTILNKRPRAWSAKYKLYMPYWMAITSQGHGIHELPEYPNGYKEGAASIGRAVSHGCVRLPVGAAPVVYNWANVGDTVYVHR